MNVSAIESKFQFIALHFNKKKFRISVLIIYQVNNGVLFVDYSALLKGLF